MNRFIVLSSLFAAVLVAPLSVSAQEAGGVDTSSLDRSLRSVLAVDAVAKSKVGVYAVDLESGQVLASRRGDDAFNPASNQKLFTAATALDVFGPGHRWYTRLRGTEKAGVVDTLYVEAVGDPSLHFEHLLDWTTELKAKGITRIEGDIVIDEGAFGSGLPPAFDQKDEDAAYRPAIGAFSVAFNGVSVIVEPGENGGPARVRLDPPNDYVRVENSAKTVSGKSRRAYVSARSEGDVTVVKVTGKIGTSATPVVARKRIESPSLFAGAALERALEWVGIEVGGTVKVGDMPKGLPTLVSHESQSVAHVVYLMNKYSNNFMAEMLFRHVGLTDEGHSDQASQASYIEVAKKVGVDIKGLSVTNGSGLYDGNLVSPRQVGALLVGMSKHRWGAEFEASLPIAGVDGTLSRRLRGESTQELLRGKTGTLNEVTALSGYVTTAGGRRLAYVIIFNDTPIYAWRLRSAQDDIAEVIAEFPE
jgi:D-alanyl-D-alanine carboxypeptidase/D-alanyl-D-alanine-endopeptidase (penicillin-binding protein 4)